MNNGGSYASTYKVSTGEERNCPRLGRNRSVWIESSLANDVLGAGP